MMLSMDQERNSYLFDLAFHAFCGIDEKRVEQIRNHGNMADILYAYDNLSEFWRVFNSMSEDQVLEFHRMYKAGNVVSIMKKRMADA